MNIVIIFRKSIKNFQRAASFYVILNKTCETIFLTDAINPSFFSNFAVKFYI